MVSSRKLALAEQFIELTRARDWSRLELLSDDVVYRPIEQITETGQYVGREGLRSYMEGFTESGWASSVDVGAATFLQVGDAVIVRIELAGRLPHAIIHRAHEAPGGKPRQRVTVNRKDLRPPPALAGDE